MPPTFRRPKRPYIKQTAATTPVDELHKLSDPREKGRDLRPGVREAQGPDRFLERSTGEAGRRNRRRPGLSQDLRADVFRPDGCTVATARSCQASPVAIRIAAPAWDRRLAFQQRSILVRGPSVIV